MVNRWFVRCRYCLSVAAVETQPSAYDSACSLCGGPIEVMGRVDGDRLVHDETRCACDERCTHARGPICSCRCGGENHGSHRVVHVVVDAGGVPRVQMPSSDAALRIAYEYIGARDALVKRLDVLYARRRAGEFLPSADFALMRELRRRLEEAASKRTHVSRMKLLTLAIPEPATVQAAPAVVVPMPVAVPAAPAGEPQKGGMAIYKGRGYRVLWIGETKYGRRAHLGFIGSRKDFWVDANQLQVPETAAA